MLHQWTPSALLFLSIAFPSIHAVVLPFKAPDADVLALEGVDSVVESSSVPSLRVAAPPSGGRVSRAGWTVTADSQHAGNEAQKAIDGNTNTFWHSEYTPNPLPFPHTFTIDMKSVRNVDGFAYLPRQDTNSNGNIGQHKIYTSTDGTNFGSPVAFGTYLDDKTEKITSFQTIPARYVRIVVQTEAGNRGSWTSAAEFNVYEVATFTATPKSLGSWGPTIDFPLVPVSGAVEHDTGKILVWSSWAPDTFGGANGGKTLTSTYDTSAGIVTQRLVSNTAHDMFCPGLSVDFQGRPVVTGGNNAPKTSVWNPSTAAWSSGADMKTPRGYHSSVTVSDGKTFVIGGSWSGGVGNKNGEIYDPTANTWTSLPGCPVAPMLTTNDNTDNAGGKAYREDNHGWLFGWKGQNVFQAGPSASMNWYDTKGSGTQKAAGKRAADTDAMCGNAVMYDAVNGKIFTNGGATSYQDVQATSNAHIITLGDAGVNPTVTKVANSNYARTFANAVVLPNGKVFVTGGQLIGHPFSDDNAMLTPELWDPATNSFTKMAPNTIPRTYHSIALLTLDGTVFSGGGGLCGAGCSTNHFDAQIWTPPYLYNADGSAATRPVISALSANNVVVGGSITVTTNVAASSMSLVRFGSATHTVNTDQRRIPLSLTGAGTNKYTFTVPSDPGVAMPGYWMLFAMNSAGVPSVAKTVQIKPS